ncbi:hypothetical protein J0688_25270, partial [Vibrio parahaemolyticus]|nr:hypothetical protein [Vibrio parahaemolyticus]
SYKLYESSDLDLSHFDWISELVDYIEKSKQSTKEPINKVDFVKNYKIKIQDERSCHVYGKFNCKDLFM